MHRDFWPRLFFSAPTKASRWPRKASRPKADGRILKQLLSGLLEEAKWHRLKPES